jgi:1,4-alpha-glucan branching enzyme
MTNAPDNRLGAVIDAHVQTHFRVWAPRAPHMQLHLDGTFVRLLEMETAGRRVRLESKRSAS